MTDDMEQVKARLRNDAARWPSTTMASDLRALLDSDARQAAEIGKLSAGWREAFNCGTHHQARADALQSENARLREGLRPFGRAFHRVTKITDVISPLGAMRGYLKLDDFRQAAALVRGEPK